MEEIIDSPIPEKKIYKERAIWMGSFLGGPLVAGYLIAENFKAFDKKTWALKTWIFTILATILIFGCIFYIPNIDNLPKQSIVFIYTIIAYLIVKKFQGKDIEKHIDFGGHTHKLWRVVIISLLGTIVTIIPIIGYVYLTDTETTKTYGSLKHEIVYDKNDFTELEIDRLASGFISTNFFDDSFKKTIYIKREDNDYIFSIPIKEGFEKNNEFLQFFVSLKDELQTFSPLNKISIYLVVDDLNNVVYRIN